MSENQKASKMSEEHNERIATLETSYTNLHRDVQNLADAVGNLGRDFRSTMDGLQKQLNESNRTPWGVLASWAGVILLLMGIIGSFYVRDLEAVSRNNEAQGIALLQFQEKEHDKEIELLERLHKIELLMEKGK